MATENRLDLAASPKSDCVAVERTYKAEEVNPLLSAIRRDVRPLADLAIKILEQESQLDRHLAETRTALESGQGLPAVLREREHGVQDSFVASETTLPHSE